MRARMCACTHTHTHMHTEEHPIVSFTNDPVGSLWFYVVWCTSMAAWCLKKCHVLLLILHVCEGCPYCAKHSHRPVAESDRQSFPPSPTVPSTDTRWVTVVTHVFLTFSKLSQLDSATTCGDTRHKVVKRLHQWSGTVVEIFCVLHFPLCLYEVGSCFVRKRCWLWCWMQIMVMDASPYQRLGRVSRFLSSVTRLQGTNSTKQRFSLLALDVHHSAVWHQHPIMLARIVLIAFFLLYITFA